MKLLDLFCSAGGAGAGYARAGFEVTGVDIDPQPRYPYRFVQADALEYLREHGHEYDAIHASPPCQRYSRLAHMPGRREQILADYPDLVGPVRELLQATGKPYIIENVPDAPLRDPITLCGAMFPGLRVFKHRGFEVNFPVPQPTHPKHPGTVKPKGTGAKMALWVNTPGAWVTVAGHLFSLPVGRAAMGIDWMNRHELAEAIPPAFTRYIADHLMAALQPSK